MCRSEHTWDTQSEEDPPPELVALLATWAFKRTLEDKEFWDKLKEVLEDGTAVLG